MFRELVFAFHFKFEAEKNGWNIYDVTKEAARQVYFMTLKKWQSKGNWHEKFPILSRKFFLWSLRCLSSSFNSSFIPSRRHHREICQNSNWRETPRSEFPTYLKMKNVVLTYRSVSNGLLFRAGAPFSLHSSQSLYRNDDIKVIEALSPYPLVTSFFDSTWLGVGKATYLRHWKCSAMDARDVSKVWIQLLGIGRTKWYINRKFFREKL